jgi:NAD(P)-dependent dehydrogenase (short-subunit alcohol dehydrogenase family)
MDGLFSADLFAGKAALITGAGPWSEGVADAFRRGGASALVIGHLEDADEVAAAFDRAEEGCGPADILITGPAPRLGKPAASTRQSDWRTVAGSGYDGSFFCCGEFARRRKAAHARGWILALIDRPGSGAVATEAAVAGGVANLVKTLGAEWARNGLRVNGLSSSDWEAASTTTLSAMALYLCSPYSGFVTAAILEIGAD